MKNKTILVVIFILFFLVLLRAFLFSSKYVSDISFKKYSLFVVDKYKESVNMVAYNVLIGEDKFIVRIYQNDEVDISSYKNLKYGDVLNITGKILVPEYMNNPGEFNYKYYLYSNNIHGEVTIKKINSVIKDKLNFKEKAISYI